MNENKELSVHSEESKWVVMHQDTVLIPPEISELLWRFGANPFGFLNGCMRDATPEEQETITKNIKKRSILTGVNFWDYIEGENTNMKEIRIKYHNKDIEKIKNIEGKSDWYDLRAAEDVTLKAGEFKLISLGVSMQLPEGYEAHIVPRSSTFKNFGIIQTNHQAVIDNSYCGNDDVWKYPAYALRDTEIHINDRICQFRIVENQPKIQFEEVDFLNGKNRGGIGTSGKQ